MERSLSPDSSGIEVEILQFGYAEKRTGIVFYKYTSFNYAKIKHLPTFSH